MIAAKNAKVAKADWKTVKLGEISVDGGHYGIGAPAVEYDERLPTYLRITDIRDDGSICKEGLKSVDSEDAEEYYLKPNDLVIARTGASTGRNYFYDGRDGDFVYAGFLIKFSIDENKIWPPYVKYWFKGDEYRSWLNNHTDGSTRANINAVTLAECPIRVPKSLPTQRKIAAVLGTLDDKIENNRKICANLEAQAQALFKSWFVDFEPFGGKMPKDWKVGKLGDVVESMINGDWGKDKSDGKNNSPVYCIRGADIPAVIHGEKGKMPLRYILPQNYKKKELVDGNIVVEISGGSPTQSTGRAALITQSLLMRYNRGLVCTNFCKAIKPIKDYSCFLYFYWRYLYDKGIFFQYENGTTGIKNLDINGVLSEYSIALPDSKINNEFNFKIKKCVELIFQKGHENEKLAELRDALLPKLMSGELDVSEVAV